MKVVHFVIHRDGTPGDACTRCGKIAPQKYAERCRSCPRGNLYVVCGHGPARVSADSRSVTNHPGHVSCSGCIEWIQQNVPSPDWTPIRARFSNAAKLKQLALDGVALLGLPESVPKIPRETKEEDNE